MNRDCQITRNKEYCTCTYEMCPRRGRCCECVIYHRQSAEIPGCFFSQQVEKSYDRSIRKFIESQRVKKYDE